MALLTLFALVAADPKAADPFWAQNETRTFIEMKRLVDWTRCDLSDVDPSRLASPRTAPGRHLFPQTDCRLLEWVGGAFAAGLNPPIGTFFKDPTAAAPAKPSLGETVYPGDRLCREDRTVVAFLGDRVVLEGNVGEGENCWRERHLGPRPFPSHWRRCPFGSPSPEASARPPASAKQAPRAVFAHVDCTDLALQAVTTSKSRFRGIETLERTAILVDRSGQLQFVRGGDRVCKSGLAVRDVGPTRILIEPDAAGRNCFRP